MKLRFDGNVKLPLKLLNQLNIKPGDELEASIRGGRYLIIRKKDQCIYCGSNSKLIKVGNLRCCKTCGEALGLLGGREWGK